MRNQILTLLLLLSFGLNSYCQTEDQPDEVFSVQISEINENEELANTIVLEVKKELRQMLTEEIHYYSD